MSVRWWKHCVSCGEAFDIGTNYEFCPECRMKRRENDRREKDIFEE